MEVDQSLIDRINELKSDMYDVSIQEEYKYITYPGVRSNKYIIGNYGTIYNVDKDMIMSQSMGTAYMGLTLSKEKSGEYTRFTTHRLVAWEFVDGYSDNKVVNHKDSVKTHNYDYNLEWCTPSENSYHGFNNDYTYSKKRSLSKKEVKKICEMFQNGMSIIEVFRSFTGLQGKKDDEKTYKKLVRIYTREYYKNVSKYYKW